MRPPQPGLWPAHWLAVPPGQPLAAAYARPGPAEGLLRALATEAAVLGGGRLMVVTPGLHVLLNGTPGPMTRLLELLSDLPGIVAAALPGAEALPAWMDSHAAPPPAGPRVTLFADAAGRTRAQLLTLPHQTAGQAGGAGPRWLHAALQGVQALLRPGLPLVVECPADHGLEAVGTTGASPEAPLAPVAALPLVALAWPRQFALQIATLRRGGWRPALIAAATEGLAWMPDGALWHLAPSGPAPARLPQGGQLLLLGSRPAWAPDDAWHVMDAA